MALRRVPVVAQPPTPPSVSLLDMAIIPQGEVGPDGMLLGNRWESGIAWQPRQCGNVGGRNECAPATSVAYRTGSNGRREHQPVIVTAVNDCKSTFGMDWAYERQTAIDTLLAAEPVAAEEELWDGVLARAALLAGDSAYAKNLWLTKRGVATDITPTAGTGVAPVRALGLLEDFLADSGFGSAGMIHMRPSVLAHMPWDMRLSGRQMFSPRNTLLVPGGGYTGNGPALADVGASRTVTDGSLTSGSKNLGSATAAFGPADVGATVTGTGIPAGATITSITSATVAVISANATSTGTGRSVTVVQTGAPTAPAAGTTWMYATGRVTYRHGEIQVVPDGAAQAINRATNANTVTAQRSTAGTWDSCAVGAVLVSYPSGAVDGGTP